MGACSKAKYPKAWISDKGKSEGTPCIHGGAISRFGSGLEDDEKSTGASSARRQCSRSRSHFRAQENQKIHKRSRSTKAEHHTLHHPSMDDVKNTHKSSFVAKADQQCQQPMAILLLQKAIAFPALLLRAEAAKSRSRCLAGKRLCNFK